MPRKIIVASVQNERAMSSLCVQGVKQAEKKGKGCREWKRAGYFLLVVIMLSNLQDLFIEIDIIINTC